MKRDHGLLPARRRRRARGDLDRRRLHRRRPARLHRRDAGVLPARGSLERRAEARGRRQRLSQPVRRARARVSTMRVAPGAIAQLGERLAGSQKVAGSSPAGSIRFKRAPLSMRRSVRYEPRSVCPSSGRQRPANAGGALACSKGSDLPCAMRSSASTAAIWRRFFRVGSAVAPNGWREGRTGFGRPPLSRSSSAPG